MNNLPITARLYAIRVLVVIQTFYPAQTAVLADRKEVRNPLLHIAATVSIQWKKTQQQH